MMELSGTELQQLASFLNSCSLKGDQSLAHAQLVIKINQALQELAKQDEATREQAQA